MNSWPDYIFNEGKEMKKGMQFQRNMIKEKENLKNVYVYVLPFQFSKEAPVAAW